MATDVNPLDSIVTILNADYNISNTDSITPTIAKIYTKPKAKEPRPNEDLIYLYSEITTTDSVGLGTPTLSEVTEVIKIDIRSRPAQTSQSNLTDDSHARKVLTEVRNILYSNVVNPDSSFNIIDPIMDTTDLSNGSRGIFRYVIRFKLISYCRDMTA